MTPEQAVIDLETPTGELAVNADPKSPTVESEPTWLNLDEADLWDSASGEFEIPVSAASTDGSDGQEQEREEEEPELKTVPEFEVPPEVPPLWGDFEGLEEEAEEGEFAATEEVVSDSIFSTEDLVPEPDAHQPKRSPDLPAPGSLFSDDEPEE